jgi:hypothetical protein
VIMILIFELQFFKKNLYDYNFLDINQWCNIKIEDNLKDGSWRKFLEKKLKKHYMKFVSNVYLILW